MAARIATLPDRRAKNTGSEGKQKPTRRKLTTLDKLKVMVSQARCPLCGEKLGALDDLHYDHALALGIGGPDTVENLQAVHKSCHAVKTNGRKATTYGSDKHAIAKLDRLTGVTGQGKRKRKIPSRPMQKGKRRFGT